MPAPDGYLMVHYAPAGGRWWVQPYLHAAAEQTQLSTLDLERPADRRHADAHQHPELLPQRRDQSRLGGAGAGRRDGQPPTMC